MKIKNHHIILMLSFILALRMLGLFMLLPVFSIFANEYENSNAFLIGAALGVYGFGQAIFIIPFGSIVIDAAESMSGQ